MLMRLIKSLVGRAARPKLAGAAAPLAGIHEVGDWWLPENDPLFELVAAKAPLRNGRRVWELAHIDSCLAGMTRRRRAIDIGAHVGFWSWMLAENFERVEAFEPHPVMQECFRRNVTASNVSLHEVALGAREEKGTMIYGARTSGQSHLRPDGTGDTEIRALDQFNFTGVDFIKMDVEGFESFVIEGAAELLKRERPVIFMESNATSLRYDRMPNEAMLMLQEMGAEVRAEMAGDNVLIGWRN